MDNLEKKTTEQQSFFRHAYNFSKRYIDYRIGIVGAGIMGGIVFGINYYDTNELLGSTTAALKQGGYTLLFGGAIMGGCKYFATKINNKTKALAASVIIPSLISISLTSRLREVFSSSWSEAEQS
ncbi:MAG: hypothetical protein WD876_00335 [Candidatus Pacearchaeota archaeon]